MTPQDRTAIQSKTKPSAPLTPEKITIAWVRLGNTIQQFCRQPERELKLCLMTGEKIVFRRSADLQRTELKLKGSFIVRQVEGVRESIEIVRTKSNGTAFVVSGRRLTATKLTLNLLLQRGSEKQQQEHPTLQAHQKFCDRL